MNHERRTDDDREAAITRARQTPDTFAGVWVARGEGELPYRDVLHVAFTDDPAPHEAELRELWHGPLVVERAPHSVRELAAVRDEVLDAFPEISSAGIQPSANAVSAAAESVTPALREAVAARFGPGLVVLVEEPRAHLLAPLPPE